VRIAQLAARQHAVVSRRQLLAMGLGGDAIRHRITTGRLHPLHRGVYAVGHRVIPLYGRYMAAVLACGPGAVASHRTAAALLGLVPSPSGDLEVTVLRACARSRRGLEVHVTRSLDPAEVGRCKGIPCTSPARTLVDLSAVLDRRRLRRALERSVELRSLDGPAMDAALGRSNGRRGVGVLRALLAALHGDPAPTRSELERLFLDLVREARLPLPVVNAHVGGYQVDFHWPAARLVLETDGRETHATPHQFEEDRRRDLELALAGWRVVRITWRQVTREPQTLVTLLRSLLAPII
jgi:very-short-patch-repair endonuclease